MNVQCLFYGSHLYLVMVSNLVSDGFSTAEYLYAGKCITFEFDQMFNGKILPWIANAYSPLYEHYCVCHEIKKCTVLSNVVQSSMYLQAHHRQLRLPEQGDGEEPSRLNCSCY